MMKIIVLTGPSSCGKTTTLNAVYDELVNKLGASSTPKQKEGGAANDFSAIVTWHNIKIAILTMGDYAYRVIECIDYFEKQGCDIFITACNDRFTTPFKKVAFYPDRHIITKVFEPDPTKHPASIFEYSQRILNLIRMNLCNHVNFFSQDVYLYLSRIFKYRLKMSEVGLTDHFVFAIVDFCKTQGISNAQIYTTGWKIESKYGNDIDLFVQRADGKYNRFALQAKVMSFNGAYDDLKLKAAPNQWDKLLDHERLFKSKSFYLFYNGKSNIRPVTATPTRSDCLGIPTIQELGLGIVETSIVKKEREGLTAPTGKLYMRHFFPNHMDAIRKLFCCEGGGYDNLEGYDYDEIYVGAPYKTVTAHDSLPQGDEPEEFDEERIPENHTDIAPFRIVVSKTHE